MNHQKGFSLIEVLVAMLIAAVAIGATMIVHANNLRQVADNADLTRAELVLTNMVSRMQVNNQALIGGDAYKDSPWTAVSGAPIPRLGLTPVQMAWFDVTMARFEAFEEGLVGAVLNIAPVVGAAGQEWSVAIDWPAHDPANVVHRGAACAAVAAANHCVSRSLRVGP